MHDVIMVIHGISQCGSSQSIHGSYVQCQLVFTECLEMFGAVTVPL